MTEEGEAIMGIFENIKLSITSLLANKMRSLLTMLGIIIGISSVIAIVTVGDSLAGSIADEMSGVGARNITVYLDQKWNFEIDEETGEMMDYEYVEPTEEDYITDEMINEYKTLFASELIGVETMEGIGSDSLTNGKNKADVNVVGVNKDYFNIENVQLLEGRFINNKDINDERYLAVVSDVFVRDYFGGELTDEEALGQSFEVSFGNKIVRLYICGVYMYLDEDGSYSPQKDRIQETNVLIPISSAKLINNSSKGYTTLVILPKTEVNMESFVQKTNEYFKSVYSKNPNIEAIGYSMESMMESTNKMINNVKMAISGVAAISLLVGGIGVMNIMMVSITERTREIGIRKALGAGKGIILLQFIIEAVIICVIGGIIGVLLGIFLGSIGAKIMGYAVKTNIMSIVYAVSFSMLIGVFFGYYPASKAAKMNPIDALRYE